MRQGASSIGASGLGAAVFCLQGLGPSGASQGMPLLAFANFSDDLPLIERSDPVIYMYNFINLEYLNIYII